ncbi:MAG: PIN domain-containing protein [Thermodesulfovibrionales bacterium]|nr:PIN domain-containing protein [Thermodesulfovibrionales bacterium]
MNDRIFIDTNILVYASIEDKIHADKRKKAINLIQNEEHEIVISTQVVNEYYVILLKNAIKDEQIQERILEVVENAVLVNITFKTIQFAWEIRDKYKYSYWDSLIISSALENNCSVLFTEDMQDGQVIEGTLKIVNPFKMMYS